MTKTEARAQLREDIIYALSKPGYQAGTWTYVIRNIIKMDHRRRHTTTQIRRELRRMERDGLVKEIPSISALYLNWRLK